MQILKGNVYKSITVENLLKSTNSCCYVYNNTQLPFDNYYVNSNVATLMQLQGYFQELIEYIDTDKYYDYFIIYTNNTEEELTDLIKWLDGKESKFNCKCIFLVCK